MSRIRLNDKGIDIQHNAVISNSMNQVGLSSNFNETQSQLDHFELSVMKYKPLLQQKGFV